MLLLAFAFTVMADPVSSVAYAIEAALRALDGDLGLIVPTMGLVVAIIAVIVLSYQQIVARYPHGGGAAAATSEAFGEAWSFVPLGALVVDFVITIAISSAAGASAVIAFLPSLAPLRLVLAVGIAVVVGLVTLLGHLGRTVFATMTLAFVALTLLVLVLALSGDGQAAGETATTTTSPAVVAVALAFPVAMALATGVEAPASAIAELGELDDDGRRSFGAITLWLTLGVVGTLTVGLAVAARHLGAGIPEEGTTMVAEIAQAAAGPGLFTVFQVVTALLLLAAAASSYQAGPGLLAALARRTEDDGAQSGVLPPRLGRTNARHAPTLGVIAFTVAAALVTAAAGGQEQTLVLFYAVSVFLSFVMGLLAMAKLSHADGRTGRVVLNLGGAVVVAFTLVVNLARVTPIVSLVASLVVAAAMYASWARAGRPRTVAAQS
ncbi:amino acid permease [Rhodococcus aerolatus]